MFFPLKSTHWISLDLSDGVVAPTEIVQDLASRNSTKLLAESVKYDFVPIYSSRNKKPGGVAD